MKIDNFLKLVITVVVCEVAGMIGTIFTAPSIPAWYAALTKPPLNPPAWVFGPVWTILFALMGISLFLIWKSASFVTQKERRVGIILFFVQLALNIFWSIIFFGLHNPAGAFVDIILLWFAILATIIAFAKISKPAAWLLVPYVLWVSFAAYLNFAIWMVNR